jgi:hypothetical protein
MRFGIVLVLALTVIGMGRSADGAQPKCIMPPIPDGRAPSRQEVAGHYAAVSESEWNLEVWLHPNGKAEIVSEGWKAGHYNERTTTRYRGSWSLSGPFVALQYSGRCETLRFDSSLSFAAFGAQGSAPGLQGLHSSVSFNLFLGNSLWRSEYLESIREVE